MCHVIMLRKMAVVMHDEKYNPRYEPAELVLMLANRLMGFDE